MPVSPLPPGSLRPSIDSSTWPFETTATLEPLEGPLGQERAVEALSFGSRVRGPGYNIFLVGPPGVGKRALLTAHLERVAPGRPAPSDWCYVYRFSDPRRPRALRMPAGRAVALRANLERLVAELRVAIPRALEAEELGARKRAVEQEFAAAHGRPLEELGRRALERGLAIVRTPEGLELAPARGEHLLTDEEVAHMSAEETAKMRASSEELEAAGGEVLRSFPRLERELGQRLLGLDREAAAKAARAAAGEVAGRWADVPEVVAHVEELVRDVADHARAVVAAAQGGPEDDDDDGEAQGDDDDDDGPRDDGFSFRRYKVNVFVDHSATRGAPAVYEDHPTHGNVMGRIEHRSRYGALLADFTLIQPGAIHRANGGYLVLDARRVLDQPPAWEALKRALRTGRVRLESLVAETITLEPDPIPLDVKVLLYGEHWVYQLLAENDLEFPELFKVPADFATDIDRSPETDLAFARLVAAIVRREALRAADRPAVASLLELAARRAEDANKLSTHVRGLADLLHESDELAAVAGRDVITAEDVAAAVAGRVRRTGRPRARMQEAIQQGELLVETRGERVGQVNGLSVMTFAEVPFAIPTRVTARVRVGAGDVLDIEREVELGGPIHSKGVLVLRGFLGGRYALDAPLALSASLVFEQSYDPVDGDSASCAELGALLSALADAPVRQALALTGSVSQLGQVQPVGAINEKIEGFFDAGGEGVLIPVGNVRHLVLRQDVVAAAAAGRFRVCAVRTIDEAMELLTGVPAGERDEGGRFPPGSLNARVEARLAAFARSARRALSPRRARRPRGDRGPRGC